MQMPETGANVQCIVVYGKPHYYKNSTIGYLHSAWDFRQTLESKHDAALMVEGAIDA